MPGIPLAESSEQNLIYIHSIDQWDSDKMMSQIVGHDQRCFGHTRHLPLPWSVKPHPAVGLCLRSLVIPGGPGYTRRPDYTRRLGYTMRPGLYPETGLYQEAGLYPEAGLYQEPVSGLQLCCIPKPESCVGTTSFAPGQGACNNSEAVP